LQKIEKALIATSNKGKIKEFQKIFSELDLVSLADLNIEDAIEDGLSFVENAIIKARHGAKHSRLYSIADDSGLVVPELGFEPGIYSARYAGENSTDALNRDKLRSCIKDLGKESLEAYFVCVIVGIQDESDPLPIVSSGTVHGKVSIHESGEGGFGYDKLFYPDGFDMSMASIDAETKNKISHRGKASKNFIVKFKKIGP
jgi:XTP/dITP diphosphohydrolase